jgi:hypothetical protein
MDEDPKPAVKSITLNESDRELISLAARLLMAQEPGQSRQDGAELLVQNYRDDLADAHPGVDPAALEEMTLNFAAALLLEMERWVDDDADEFVAKETRNRGAFLSRQRVIAALGQLVAALDSRH